MEKKLVSVGGLEPPSLKQATDFKSVVYTVSTTLTIFMLELIVLSKAITEFVLFLYIGRCVLYILAFGRHNDNLIYRILLLLTQVPEQLVSYITVKTILQKHLPYFTFIFFLSIWLVLLIGKVIIGGPSSFNIQQQVCLQDY